MFILISTLLKIKMNCYNKIMISQHTHKNLSWIDLEKPTKEEVAGIMEKFKIHPLVGNELLIPSDRSKVDVYDNFIYLILHFPKYGHQANEFLIQEVDFIIGRNFLITTHYESIDPLLEFSKLFETDSILDKSKIGDNAGFLFFYIMRKMYEYTELETKHVNNKIKEAEAKIFVRGNERQMVEELSSINREMIDLRRAIKGHGDILKSYENASVEFFGNKYQYYIATIYGEFNKIWNELESLRELLVELKNSNDGLFQARANDIIQTLTIMAFVTFPLSLIAAIFGMNTSTMPIVGLQNDFWIVVGIMAVGMIFMFIFFKYKKWI